MPTNDDLQKAFPLVSYLQPDRAVAVCVLLDAYDRVEVFRKGQERRPDSDCPYKLRIPEENLPQYCIYEVSQKWEMDQESDCSSKEPRYKPTPDDLLIRYIKTLALVAMDWRSPCYAAVAVGGYLYTYRPKQISDLVLNSDNIRRVKGRVFKRLEKRFPGICNGGGHVSLEAPSERQRALVNKSLSALAPLYSCQIAHAPGLETNFLDICFDKDSDRPELERIHIVFDTKCCGFARLVREYNSSFPEWSKMRLDDPDNKLRVPKFGDGHGGPDQGEGEDGPPDPDERFNPSPLTPAEASSIRHKLNRNQRRRKLYRPGNLRVYVDGEATATLTRERASASLAIPDTASCVEVFGEDDDGELLLAVFPLGLLESDGATLSRELYVTHGGGSAFEISLSPAPVQSRNSSESVLRLEYRETGEDAGAGAVADAHAAPVIADPFVDEDSPGADESPPGRVVPGTITFPVPLGTPAHEVYGLGEIGGMTQNAVAFWSEAYDGYFDRLCAYARHRLTRGNWTEAEDVVSEAFLRVMRYSERPEEITNVLSYLLKMVQHIFRDRWRAENVQRKESLDDLVGMGRDPAVEPEVFRVLESEELRAEMMVSRGPLSSREKLLLTLHLQGYTADEIASRLGENIRMTRSDLNALRAKVRYRLMKKKT